MPLTCDDAETDIADGLPAKALTCDDAGTATDLTSSPSSSETAA